MSGAQRTDRPRADGPHVLLLAAGHGRRMGGPKAFTLHKGRSFLTRVLERCRQVEARVTLVTDPQHQPAMEAALAAQPPPFPRIVTADGAAPMLASVQAALRAGPYEPGWWLWPVDAPFISAAAWQNAATTAAGDPNVVWKLRSQGRTGHPTWFPFMAAPAILAGDWPDGLRGYLATQLPERIQVLELEGEVLEDVNDPAKLAGLNWLD